MKVTRLQLKALSGGSHNATQGDYMSETKQQNLTEEVDRELTEQEIAEVTGGFNPQPEPPRH